MKGREELALPLLLPFKSTAGGGVGFCRAGLGGGLVAGVPKGDVIRCVRAASFVASELSSEKKRPQGCTVCFAWRCLFLGGLEQNRTQKIKTSPDYKHPHSPKRLG